MMKHDEATSLLFPSAAKQRLALAPRPCGSADAGGLQGSLQENE